TEELFRPRCPIQKIHNFVDVDAYRRSADPCVLQRVAPHGEKILLHMSNFRAVKRVQDVIAVFQAVREQVPSKLLLVGEGPDLDLARRTVARENLVHDVLFLGKRDEVAPLLSLADLLLLPSQKESFGLVALEAMACGVPVIGSRAGGIPEVVEDGRSGFLLPVGDVGGMAECATLLLKDSRLWSEFSVRARERASLFSTDEKVSEYERVYERVLTAEYETCP
ncbi:MAG: glycosyltransferase, partial [Firmicutes bacterium]|nr:glycosyltransferase [Bacillota bacterium]